MVFKIADELLSAGGGIYTGVVVAKGLDNNTVNEKINELFTETVKSLAKELEGKTVKTLEAMQPYHKAMNELGINPSKYPCSIEALLSRIVKKGELPSISPVVDLGNYISLKYKVPVGVHDTDTMAEDLMVRPATLEDVEANADGDDAIKVGEPVYAVGTSVRTRRWLWRQMSAGRTTSSSANFIFPIDGFISNRETIDAACEELAALIGDIFGVTASTGAICRETPEFLFGELTEEEQEIENQIAIMLKGVADHTAIPEIRAKLQAVKREGRPLRIKLGLDPSAPDIHVGHTVVLRKIRQLQELGHTAIIIIGDYTGMIGDPTGKSKTRKQLSREDVERNANTYMEQIFKVIDKNRTEVYYNSQWLSKMNFGDVIELAAKCTVARMLERDDFNNRYTNHLPLSVHEFFYPLMQAYDSVAVKADIELGGTDQTFNILMGRNIQRDYGQTPQLTLFMPLLEGIDGVEKMSKSLGNYIGISEDPAVIFEKVMKIPDSMIIKYYNLCTDVHPDEVAKLQAMLDNGTNPRDIKMLLAHEITELYSGKEAADNAELRFKSVFQKGQVPDDAPVITVDTNSDISVGDQVVTAIIELGAFKSKSDVRRIFNQGGATFDNEKLTNAADMTLTADEHILKLGKNKFFRIKK